MVLNQETINTIIGKRLTRTSDPVVHLFPSVLKTKPTHWVTISNEQLLLIVFLDPGQMAQVQARHDQGLDPFPGLLISPGAGKAAIGLSNARNVELVGNRVQNMYSIEVGPDSTAIIENHFQSVQLSGQETIEYTIPLAYLITYGDEISEEFAYDTLDQLVAYSVSQWRKKND